MKLRYVLQALERHYRSAGDPVAIKHVQGLMERAGGHETISLSEAPPHEPVDS